MKQTFLVCFLTLIPLCNATDAENLFDICPTDTTSPLHFNGYPCKPIADVSPSDFKSSLLNQPGDTGNFDRSSTTLATAAEFPGLNTLGLSAARTDIELDGVVMPHAHPRASEMIFVRAGEVAAGFVDSNNQVFQKRLREGDVFVFPKGLLHFCFNAGFEAATMYSVMNSQNPGIVRVSGAMFVSEDLRRVMVERVKGLGVEDLDGISTADLFGE